MEIRAEFDDPIKAKQAKAALEALGASSLSISSRSQESGATTRVTVGDGKQGGFLNALSRLFGGGTGKGGVSAGGHTSIGASKTVRQAWSFGSSAPADDGVVHESFKGTHHETVTVRIGDSHAEAARAALRQAGATSVA